MAALDGASLTPAPRTQLVFTCEHGGREVPRSYAALFAGRKTLLDSHRGWDAGALELARQMADAFRAPLHASTTTRLLVDLNRSIGHRHLFSEITCLLPEKSRHDIVERHYRPHRQAVQAELARLISSGGRVVHVASHSFTPTLDDVPRHADVAWLYDPRRPGEVTFAQAWMRNLATLAPEMRLRRNYPYRGRDDGLTAALRKRYPDSSYVGIELEINQRFVAEGGAPWERLKTLLVSSLKSVADTPDP
ncbi:MAG: N-formylglutamate amidohydrolase [Burkholderiaceae bacterium]